MLVVTTNLAPCPVVCRVVVCKRSLKQKVPFRSREQEAYLSLLRTADALQAQVETRLKEFGLTGTQYNALRILRGAGPDGLPRREIGDRMITRDPDITRLLNRLEERGLGERTLPNTIA